MTELDGDRYVALLAHQVREGDTLWLNGERVVCWGAEREWEYTGGPVTMVLSIHDGAAQVTLKEPFRTHLANPVWVDANDARIGGRTC